MLLLSSTHLHAVRQGLDTNITWVAPKANETLLAGQDYLAKWNASSTPNSLSFRLCLDPRQSTMGDDTTNSSCGSAVAAPFQQAQGVYFVSVTLPNITSTNLYVIKMFDASGFQAESPLFFIQQPPASNGTISSSNATAPEGWSTPGLSFNWHDSGDGPDARQPLLIPKPAPSISKRNLDQFFPTPAPMYTALAIIPLILVTAGLAVSVFLWFRQRRSKQLKRLYLTEHQMIYPRRPQAKTLNSAEDLESAVQSLSKERFRARRESGSQAKHGSNRAERKEQERRLEQPVVAERISYEPESRSLTDSYFPSVLSLGPSNSRGGLHHSAFLGNPIVESPMDMMAVPPPLSVTKLSERLHLRTRSNNSMLQDGLRRGLGT